MQDKSVSNVVGVVDDTDSVKDLWRVVAHHYRGQTLGKALGITHICFAQMEGEFHSLLRPAIASTTVENERKLMQRQVEDGVVRKHECG